MVKHRIQKYFDLTRLKLLGKLLHNEKAQERTYFTLAIITAITSALTVVAFKGTIHLLINIFKTNESFGFEAIFWGLGAVIISGFVTTRFFPETTGSGIPKTVVSLAVHHGHLPLKDTIAKFFTSLLTLFSGVPLGTEGPVVRITSGIGSFLGRFFSLPKKQVKSLVAIGVAGGISAAFQAPIAAVVFTLEEVVGDLNARVLGPIIVASVISSVTATMLIGDHNIFNDLHYKLESPSELLIYLIIGILASILGSIWVKSVLKSRTISMKVLKGHQVTFMIICFAMVALVSHITPDILGTGVNDIRNAIISVYSDWRYALLLFGIKFLLVSLCYSSGISGGLFMPSLALGALLGATVGLIAKSLFPEITTSTGAFAIVGMGAFFVTVIRAPFTSIIMVFELTRDYNIILPLMIANIVAYTLAKKFHEGSIYESIAEQDGVHLPKREDNEALEGLTVESAMDVDVITLNAFLTIDEAFHLIRKKTFASYPVIKNGKLIGMVAKDEISTHFAKKNFKMFLHEVCSQNLITIYPDQSLLVAFHKLNKFQISKLPVVSRLDDKQLIGLINAEHIVSRFGYHIQEEEAQIAEIKTI